MPRRESSIRESCGVEWAERERCPVEQGRNLQGLAAVAERRGEHEQELEHLQRAGELFSRHGAKLYLDQVIARKLPLQGVVSSARALASDGDPDQLPDRDASSETLPATGSRPRDEGGSD